MIEPVDKGNITTLRPEQNGANLADDIFKYIFLKYLFYCILIQTTLTFGPKCPIDS